MSACVGGTPKQAGPMIATVSSIAAALAAEAESGPEPLRDAGERHPPASAIQKPPVGAARGEGRTRRPHGPAPLLQEGRSRSQAGRSPWARP